MTKLYADPSVITSIITTSASLFFALGLSAVLGIIPATIARKKRLQPRPVLAFRLFPVPPGDHRRLLYRG